MDNRTGNILTFTRRPINEWPKSVYLADLGDGEGCRPYSHIQRPDDTTPEYVRYDLYFAAVAARDRLQRENERLKILVGRNEAPDMTRPGDTIHET